MMLQLPKKHRITAEDKLFVQKERERFVIIESYKILEQLIVQVFFLNVAI